METGRKAVEKRTLRLQNQRNFPIRRRNTTDAVAVRQLVTDVEGPGLGGGARAPVVGGVPCARPTVVATTLEATLHAARAL